MVSRLIALELRRDHCLARAEFTSSPLSDTWRQIADAYDCLIMSLEFQFPDAYLGRSSGGAASEREHQPAPQHPPSTKDGQ